jgi:hypothetical protein
MVCPNIFIGPCPTSLASHSNPITLRNPAL